ncbi:YciI family protein [bacterium]|nr:YciI family protein [bacterium]MCI0602729.1 YciI family protein [bacterium]
MKDEETPLPEEMIRSLKSETPPNHLERRVVNALKSGAFIQTKRTTLPRHWWKPAVAAMLLASFFGVGFWLGHRPEKKAATSTNQPLFALFLYERIGHFAAGPGHVQEYGQWIRSVGSSGQIAGGEKLKEDGRSMQIRNGKLEIDSLRVENEQVVMGGYFLIQAANYEEALKIASGCPHLKYGGMIEVRQIDAT